jgi:tetratricopeptide (TPR) repeat protein
MSRPAPARPGFSLQLEHGSGRLVLTDRPVGLFVVETLALSLRDVPGRLDLRVGADRFRHQRTRLDRLVITLDEEALGQALAIAARGTPLQDLEARITEGDVVVAGSVVEGGTPTPFLCRLRPVPAGLAGQRLLLISAYETRIFGPCAWPVPVLAQRLMGLLGLEPWLQGGTLAVLDPVDRLTLEVCAALGWKAPDRTEVKVEALRCEGGRLSLVAARPVAAMPGPRPLPAAGEAAFRERRFLEAYEACSLFSHIEAQIAQGDTETATRGLRRQLEIHPGHAFLVGRLLQLQAPLPEAAAEVRSLAGARLARFPDDVEALLALAAVRAREGAGEEAAELFDRVGALARRRGDALEAAQAAWAAAAARAIHQPRAAIAAYEEALRTHHRLPGLLRALVDLHERVGDQAAALRIQQRLAAAAASPEERREHLLRLGAMAVASGHAALGRQAFENVLADHTDDVAALDGLAGAALIEGEHLAAVQSLDRAARLLRGRGDLQGAADRTTRLGDLWASLPDGSATAQLRYRQALLLVPHHAPALLGLAELARREGDRATARTRFEELLRVGPEGFDRAEVHLRLGRLLAEPPIEDAGLAAAHLQKAIEGSPAQADAALESLEALHQAAGRFDDVARVLERAVEQVNEPAVRALRLWRLARVLIDHLGDRRRAVVLLHQAAALDPESVMIPEALAQLHRQAGEHVALAAILARLTQRIDDPTRLCALYLERAELLRLHLNQANEAATAYAAALGCRPDSREALAGLADVYRGQDRPAELVEVLQRQARLEPGRDGGWLWLERARLLMDVLHRPDAAVASLEAAAHTLPDEPEVLRRLGDLHFSAGRYEVALASYGRLAAAYAEEGFDEPAAPFLRRLAATQAAAGRVDEALASLEQAAREAPDEVATAEQAQDLLLKSGELERIARFFQTQLERARRPDARAFLARRAGRLLWRELRRPAEAAPLLDEALRADPGDGDVQRIRLEVATAQGEWERVAALLEAQIAGAPAARRPALMVRLAQVLGSELGRKDEGRRILADVLGGAQVSDGVPDGPRTLRAGAESAIALLQAWGAQAPAEAAPPEVQAPLAPVAPTAVTPTAETPTAETPTAETPTAETPPSVEVSEGSLEDVSAVERLSRSHDGTEVTAPSDAGLLRAPPRPADPATAPVPPPVVERIEAPATEHPTRRLPTRQPLSDSVDDFPSVFSSVRGAALAEQAGVKSEPAEGPGSPTDSRPLPASEASSRADVKPSEPATESASAADARVKSADTLTFSTVEASTPLAAPHAGEAEPSTMPVPPVVVGERSSAPEPPGPATTPVPPPIEPAGEASPLAEPAGHPGERTADRVVGGVEEDELAAGLRAREAAVANAASAPARAQARLLLAEYWRDALHQPDAAIPVLEAVVDEAQAAGGVWTEAIEALEDLYALRRAWESLLSLYDRRGAAGLLAEAERRVLRAATLRSAGRLENALDEVRPALPDERARVLEVELLLALGRKDEAVARLVADADRLDAARAAGRMEGAEEAALRLDEAARVLADDAPQHSVRLQQRAHATHPSSERLATWLQAARRSASPELLALALQAQAREVSAGPRAAARQSRLLLEGARELWILEGGLPAARSLVEASLAAWPDNLDALLLLDELLVALDDSTALLDVLDRQLAAAVPGPWRDELEQRRARLLAPNLVVDSRASEADVVDLAMLPLLDAPEAGQGIPSTPKNASPENATPENATPENATPENATPENASPENATPENATPENATPENATPENATPENATPENATPENATPENATPENATPENATPENATPENATPPPIEAASRPAERPSGKARSARPKTPKARPNTPAPAKPAAVLSEAPLEGTTARAEQRSAERPPLAAETMPSVMHEGTRPLSQAPADPELAHLWRIGDRIGLAEALARQAERARGALRAELWARRGQALTSRLETAAEAEVAFQAALAEADAPLDVVLVAVQALARTRTTGPSPHLLAHVERRLVGAQDRRSRAGLLALRGTLKLERYRDLPGARADFQAAAAELPGAALAAAGLGALDAEAGAFPSALAWLQAALQAGPDNPVPLQPEQEEVTLRLLGRVLAAVGRASELPTLARSILDTHPGCLAALAVFDHALSAQGAFARLAERIEAALEAVGAPSVEWLWRQAELLAGPLRRRRDAADAVDAVLVVDPHHRPARRLALALAGERESWTDYVAHGEALLRLDPDEGSEPDVLRLAVARVYADLLAQPARSLEHLRTLDERGRLPADAAGFYVHAARQTGLPAALGAALRARVRLEGTLVARFALAEHCLVQAPRRRRRCWRPSTPPAWM